MDFIEQGLYSIHVDHAYFVTYMSYMYVYCVKPAYIVQYNTLSAQQFNDILVVFVPLYYE